MTKREQEKAARQKAVDALGKKAVAFLKKDAFKSARINGRVSGRSIPKIFAEIAKNKIDTYQEQSKKLRMLEDALRTAMSLGLVRRSAGTYYDRSLQYSYDGDDLNKYQSDKEKKEKAETDAWTKRVTAFCRKYGRVSVNSGYCNFSKKQFSKLMDAVERKAP